MRLCYMDQGAFQGLRALDRGPVAGFTWVFAEPVDPVAVDALNHQLAQGFLGRLIQRSPLPWGRHRWVAAPVPAPVTTFDTPIGHPREPAWRGVLADLPIDPECGPGWRLVVQPLAGGGAVLTLLVSHVVADGLAVCQAVADAVHRVPFAHRYPAARRGWSWRVLGDDLGRSIAEWPAVARALAALVRQHPPVDAAAARPPRRPPVDPVAASAPVHVPLLYAILDADQVQARAAAEGISVNTLIACVAVRLGERVGRVGPDGHVLLVQPVSDRQPGDLRGNALRALQLVVDPTTCTAAPRELHDALRRELAALRRSDPVTRLLPLIPYVPRWLVRKFERVALGAGRAVACSNLGTLDPAMVRPLGVRATQFYVSILERHTAAALAELGGKMLLVCSVVDGRMGLTALVWDPDRLLPADELAHHVRLTLADCGLTGTLP
jgi:hypothetical protein